MDSAQYLTVNTSSPPCRCHSVGELCQNRSVGDRRTSFPKTNSSNLERTPSLLSLVHWRQRQTAGIRERIHSFCGRTHGSNATATKSLKADEGLLKRDRSNTLAICDQRSVVDTPDRCNNNNNAPVAFQCTVYDEDGLRVDSDDSDESDLEPQLNWFRRGSLHPIVSSLRGSKGKSGLRLSLRERTFGRFSVTGISDVTNSQKGF